MHTEIGWLWCRDCYYQQSCTRCFSLVFIHSLVYLSLTQCWCCLHRFCVIRQCFLDSLAGLFTSTHSFTLLLNLLYSECGQLHSCIHLDLKCHQRVMIMTTQFLLCSSFGTPAQASPKISLVVTIHSGWYTCTWYHPPILPAMQLQSEVSLLWFLWYSSEVSH